MDTKPPDLKQGDSLEASSDDSGLSSAQTTSVSPTPEPANVLADASDDVSLEKPLEGSPGGSRPPEEHHGLQKFFDKFNVYLVLFVVILIVGGAVFVVAWLANRGTDKPTIKTQSLTQDALKQLANSDVTVGQPKQVLNVQSNAVFAGKVLIQDSLEVAGPIQVGGSLTIPGITVSGNSIFDQVQINKGLSVVSDSAFQGQVAIQKSISVAGGGTFGGALSAPQITANTLQLNGNLNLTHHITAGGATPGRVNGSNLGSGGTSSVGGSDSAGSISINTGSGASAGCYVTVNFNQRYNATPHVLITPVGSAAAALGYYINRSTTGFSICSVNTPPSFANFGFDYFVLD